MVRELIVRHARHLDVNVEAVEQRTGDALLVPGDVGIGAGAHMLVVALPAARAGIISKRTHYVTGCILISMACPILRSYHCNTAASTWPNRILPQFFGELHWLIRK